MSEESLFAAAVAIPDATARAAYLDRACAGNVELRKQLDALVAAHFSADPVFDATRSPAGADHTQSVGDRTHSRPSALEAVGTVIAGRYKLLQQIGEGGMGTVWMADQTEPVKRRVAVKLIRAERGNSATILARFEAERQAIALMDHPHIAKLLDAGTWSPSPPAGEGLGVRGSGQPFFVMELVKGVPLTEFCDAHRLSIPDRLALFMQICSAVQHAHQKGVIHRDLKPTNILVESHDGKPVPKVIDFGLAKATTGLQLTEHTLFTGFGSVMGTPLYMAPEQATFNAVDIDTRADVYALGVILYELLTGTTPLTRETIKKAALDEMLRLIREQEAPTPSSRLSSSEAKPTVAANRQTEPAKLGRFVKGELDWIVLKALSKDRDRRYETANGFAKDVERFLNHEPVTAGPPTAGYWLKKFVQRNKGPVTAGGLVVGALLLGIAGTTFGLLRAEERRMESDQARERERERADGEKAAKEREAEQRAKAVKAYTKTADVLDVMVSEVTGDSLATQKAITPEQKTFLTEVLTYYKEFAGVQAGDVLTRARTAVAASRVGMIEYRLGRYEEGVTAFRMARNGYQSLTADFPAVPAHRQELATSHHNLGFLLTGLGKRAEAEVQYRKGLALGEQLAADFPTVPDYRRELAAGHNGLGSLLAADQGKRPEAEEQYQKALTLQEKLAADFPTVPKYRQELARSHNNLGVLLNGLGKRAEEEGQYQKALAIQQKLVADFPAVPDYRRDMAASQHNLGNLLADLGQRPEAEGEYKKALAIQQKLVADFPAVPDYRQELATSQHNLGNLLAKQGNRPLAEEEYRKALAIREKLAADFPTMPKYRVDLGGSYCNLGLMIRGGGKPADSIVWFEKAISALTPVHQSYPHDMTAKKFLRNSYWSRARAYERMGKLTEAVRDWDKAVELTSIEEQSTIRPSRALIRLRAGLVAEAVAEMAELTKSPNWDAGQWYNFACSYSFAGTKITDKKIEYAERAMEMLQKAVKAGYKDIAHMKKDTDLDALRGREDYMKLLADLEVKFPPTREVLPPPRREK